MPTDSKTKGTKRGRAVTLSADWLKQRRDHLKGVFESYWPQVGWRLCRATTREEVMQALRPLENLKEPRIDLLLTDLTMIEGAESARRYALQTQRLSDDLMEEWESRVDPDERPFLVARKFFEVLRKPVSNPNLLLEELEKRLSEKRGPQDLRYARARSGGSGSFSISVATGVAPQSVHSLSGNDRNHD
jgi:hypothetical protein